MHFCSTSSILVGLAALELRTLAAPTLDSKNAVHAEVARLDIRVPPLPGKGQPPGPEPLNPNKPVGSNDPPGTQVTKPKKGSDTKGTGTSAGGSAEKELELPEQNSAEYKANLKAVNAKGQKFKNDLITAIASKGPDTGYVHFFMYLASAISIDREIRKKDKMEDLGYKTETTRLDDYLVNRLEYLDDFDIFVNGPDTENWHMRVVYSDKEEDAGFRLAVDKDQGTAVAVHSFKNQDGIQKASWTEMVYESLVSEFGSSDLSGLQYFVRHRISDVTTQDTSGSLLRTIDAIDHAFDVLRPDDLEGFLTIDFASTDPKTAEVVNYLSGQTHVGRVLQLLSDYRESFGNRNIASLHLYSGLSSERDDYSMVIELGGQAQQTK